MIGEGFYQSDEGYPSESDGYHGYMQRGAGLEGIEEHVDQQQEEEEEYDEYPPEPSAMQVQPLKLKSSSGSLGQYGGGAFATGSLGPQQMSSWTAGPPPMQPSASSGSMQYIPQAAVTPRPGQTMQYPPTLTNQMSAAVGQSYGEGLTAQTPFTPRPPSTPPVGKPPIPPAAPQEPAPYVEGVRYHSHQMPPAGAATTGRGGDQAYGFIDATQGK